MSAHTVKGHSHRRSDYPIVPLILERWSPRAMSGEPVSEAELMALFEAARWAPSCFNDQPWRFLYAPRESAEWPLLFDLLAPGNQEWCARAGVLIVVLSANNFTHNGKPNPTHRFDAGAAWENLALQGASMGLVVHGMAGFDYDKARTTLAVPDDYTVEAMIAVGQPGAKESLPKDLQDREAPNSRMPVSGFVHRGRFSR